jgi:hypothetical protein
LLDLGFQLFNDGHDQSLTSDEKSI